MHALHGNTAEGITTPRSAGTRNHGSTSSRIPWGLEVMPNGGELFNYVDPHDHDELLDLDDFHDLSMAEEGDIRQEAKAHAAIETAETGGASGSNGTAEVTTKLTASGEAASLTCSTASIEDTQMEELMASGKANTSPSPSPKEKKVAEEKRVKNKRKFMDGQRPLSYWTKSEAERAQIEVSETARMKVPITWPEVRDTLQPGGTAGEPRNDRPDGPHGGQKADETAVRHDDDHHQSGDNPYEDEEPLGKRFNPFTAEGDRRARRPPPAEQRPGAVHRAGRPPATERPSSDSHRQPVHREAPQRRPGGGPRDRAVVDGSQPELDHHQGHQFQQGVHRARRGHTGTQSHQGGQVPEEGPPGTHDDDLDRLRPGEAVRYRRQRDVKPAARAAEPAVTRQDEAVHHRRRSEVQAAEPAATLIQDSSTADEEEDESTIAVLALARELLNEPQEARRRPLRLVAAAAKVHQRS